MDTLLQLFNLGMMRNYPDIIPCVNHNTPANIILNLGPGKKHIEGALEFDYPEWDAEKDPIPINDSRVSMIHCYHFLEHIQNVPFVISEINRVLRPGGHVNIVVPYYKSAMQAQDLDHKSQYTEKTFQHLFNSHYYTKGKVAPMDIVTNFIMGDCEANLCLIVQLRKGNVSI
jgi:predicted SAM-dependent methyltransferase